MIIMDLRDAKDNLSSRFKSADAITSQIGNTRCTACKQAVNKYTIWVEKKIISRTSFTFNTCSASFNNARFFLLSWKKRMTVQSVGKNSLIWGTFLVFEVLILLIVSSAAWEVHLTEGNKVQVVEKYFLKCKRLWHNHQSSSLKVNMVQQFQQSFYCYLDCPMILIWKGVVDLEQTNHQPCLTMQLLRGLTLGTNLRWFNFANGLN